MDDLKRPVPRRLKVTFHDVDGRSASVEADVLAWIEAMPDAEFMGLESIVAHQAQVRGLAAVRAALKEQSKENTMTIAEPQPVEIHDGISYRVELRVTPNRDLNGLPSQGNQMWSADLIVDGSAIVAHGATAEEALLAIGRVVFDQSTPLEPSDG